jgi:hypothetical protein
LFRTGIIVFLITAVLITAPIYYTQYAHRTPFASRMDIVGVGGSYWMRVVNLEGGQSIENHLLMPFLTFVHMPEQALYYAGEHPMILEIFVPLFLLGLTYALWRWRGAGMLLLLWVLLTWAGNSLMTYSAIYARYVVVMPALALLMALGLHTIVPLLVPARLTTRLMTAAVLVVALVQTIFYFGPHLQYYNVQIRPRPDEEDVIFRSVPFPPGTMIHIIAYQPVAASYLFGVLGYLSDHLTLRLITPPEVTPEFLASLPRSVDHAFFVEPSDTTTPSLLAQHFMLQPPTQSPFNLPVQKQYILYYAARETTK